MILDEARKWLLSLFPPGYDNLYDVTPGTGDLYQLMDAFGQAFKTYAFDAIDTLKTELFPQSAVQKLPDWEAATNISNLSPAISGTTIQRQNALVSRLREFGPFCDPLVESVIGPLIGYKDTRIPQIIKCSRAALDTAHTYTTPSFNVNSMTGASSAGITVHDGGVISNAGVRLSFTLHGAIATDLSLFTVTLGMNINTVIGTRTLSGTMPFGDLTFHLFFPLAAGIPLYGDFQLTVQNNSGNNFTIQDWSFIVDGIGPNEETGGAIFDWGVYADPTHTGENGSTPDFTAARNAINRIEHSHTHGFLILALAPLCDGTDAIPDTFYPG